MGQRVEKPVWIADDGKEFSTQQAMMAYESEARFGALVDQYLATVEFTPGMDKTRQKSAATRLANAVLPFLLWAEAQGLLNAAAVPPAQPAPVAAAAA